jgi:CheY-like chemotaxis protein
LESAAAAKILLIEDDPALGAVTVDVIEQLGHEVHWSSSADDVFSAFAGAVKFDAIIMDIGLGRQDGVELVDALHDKGFDLPPIVLFSAQPTDLLLRAAAAVSAITILQKPCSSDQIKRALDRALHASRPASNS